MRPLIEKSMNINRILFLFLLVTSVWSCKKDDGGVDVITIPPRSLSEVALENDAEIQEYLSTHFYNYEEFASPPADFDYKIVIDTLVGDDADKTPMIDQVSSETLEVSSDEFELNDDETAMHTVYYLSAREGAGESPTVADSTFLRYEGTFLNGDLFDGITTYSWQYLPFFLRGYSIGVSKFKAGDDIIINNDGTSSISNNGIGLIIIPSGLAYFNGSGSNGSIPAYSNLIFKIDTGLFVEDTDWDGDGIPSILEDLDGDGNLNSDNTDRKQEEDLFSPAFPNHTDTDDDNDGILTRDEIEIDSNGNITFPDSDGDGTPDYLDNDN